MDCPNCHTPNRAIPRPVVGEAHRSAALFQRSGDCRLSHQFHLRRLLDQQRRAPAANLLDLNGDGRIEIVVDSFYFEGIAIRVYDVSNRRARPVLEVGCGV